MARTSRPDPDPGTDPRGFRPCELAGLRALNPTSESRSRTATRRTCGSNCGESAPRSPTARYSSRLRYGIAGMCWLHLPRKEGDRPDFAHAPTAYDAITNHHPNLYAPRALQEIFDAAEATYPRYIAACERWLRHIENRLQYEAAMLGESGGLKAEQWDIQMGGRVQHRFGWGVVTKLNRKDDALFSVSILGHFETIKIEDIRDYQAPAAGDAAKVAKATAQPPLVNWRAPNCVEMTMAQWKEKSRFSDSFAVRCYDAEHKHTWGRVKDGEAPIAYRQRTVGGWKEKHAVFITDAKEARPPAPAGEPKTPVTFDTPARKLRPMRERTTDPEAAKFEQLRDTARTGVQVVSAPQLFPTPPDVAARMVELAGEFHIDTRVLEPSAGTGNLIAAVRAVSKAAPITAIEVNEALCRSLRHRFDIPVQGADFLTCEPESLGAFDIILMNPPFRNADDIKHIEHARRLLKPGGRLVAICANGSRQRDTLQPHADTWEELPEGTFDGTGVRAVLLTISGQGGTPDAAR